MKTHRISHKDIHRFLAFLHAEDRCEGTVKKYRRDLRTFTGWLGEQAVQKKTAVEWKYHLLEEKYAPTTVNSMLAAVNAFFKFMGWHECRVKFLKVNTPPETVPLDRTNGAPRPLKWCVVTASMVH